MENPNHRAKLSILPSCLLKGRKANLCSHNWGISTVNIGEIQSLPTGEVFVDVVQAGEWVEDQQCGIDASHGTAQLGAVVFKVQPYFGTGGDDVDGQLIEWGLGMRGNGMDSLSQRGGVVFGRVQHYGSRVLNGESIQARLAGGDRDRH